MDLEVRLVGQRLHDFLAELGAILDRNPPPGTNASNIHVPRQVLDSLRNYPRPNDATPVVLTTTSDATLLFFAYQQFVAAMEDAWLPFPYDYDEDPASTYLAQHRPVHINLASLLPALDRSVLTIVAVVGKDRAAVADLLASLHQLARETQQKGNVVGGAHLHYFGPDFLRTYCQRALEAISTRLREAPGSGDSDARTLTLVVSTLCEELIQIPIGGAPCTWWVLAEWQIAVLAAVKAAAFAVADYMATHAECSGTT